MNLSMEYPSGADYELFITDPIEQGITPNFTDQEPLDVSQVSFVQDGTVTPLYDIAERNPHHMVYSRKVVNGTLSFNYSQDFADRFRRPQLQSIWGKVLWVRLTFTSFHPTRRIRDTYRIAPVYEHAFQHQPQPHATEQVPFSARELILVEREQADLAADIDAVLQREGDQGRIQASDLYRNRESRYMATVEEVVDGDTLKARLDVDGNQVDIRLSSVDTPETPGKEFGNKTDDPKYRWPENADETYGTGGSSPTEAQLDKWGLLVKDRVTEWLEGEKVWLVTDQGAASTGDFGRSVFRVDALNEIVPDHAGIEPHRNLARTLVRHGYATLYEGRSIASSGTGYRNLRTQLLEEEDAVRSVAGTNQATGFWYSFNVSDWTIHASRL